MPLVDSEQIEGVFNSDTQARMTPNVAETVIAIKGEAMRGDIGAPIHEVSRSEWSIGVQQRKTADAKALAIGGAA